MDVQHQDPQSKLVKNAMHSSELLCGMAKTLLHLDLYLC